MKAICVDEPFRLSIRDIDMPVRKKGEALLKILHAGICGSDLSAYRGTFPYFDYPRILGHEFAAQIVEIDANDLGLKEGMIVTGNPYFNCGHCYSCRHGVLNACMHNQTMGCQRDGAFCEYITMPIERIYDGKGIEPRVLAAIEPFAISYHGVQRAGVRSGDRVLVIGGGTIGVLAGAAAKASGGKVYLCDLPQAKEKLDRSQSVFLFAGTILNESPQQLESAVRDITGVSEWNGVQAANGFDICIEAVGLPQTFQDCINSVSYGGKLLQIGVGKKNLDFNFTLIQRKELNVFGSRNALKKDFLELIDLVREGGTGLEKVITKVYDFRDAARAFEELHTNGGTMLKAELDFSSV